MTWRPLVVGATVLSASVLATLHSGSTQTPMAPAYVGSAQCGECHTDQIQGWQGSHHALAWTLPSPKTVLADFDGSTFEHNGITAKFSRDGDNFRVENDGANGHPATYPVTGVAGIAPLQQYLVETEPGRQQALDTAWDVEQRRWFHLYPEAKLKAGDGLHWSGPYKTWNARCAECHATGYEKNYDARSRAYSSTQAEIGVGCEACHGPGEAHIDWAREPAGAHPGAHLSEYGFTIDFADQSSETEIQQCAGCHSRREPLLGSSPLPGTPFHDAYRLALLREGLYHADGTIDDEVYVYGSFLQSKMYAQGVRCTDCHDPHSANLKAEANDVCAQCHSPAANPQFPTLRKANYDDPSHHFHETGADGANCVSCHMIERVYMQIDGRRDHSFRVPRPDMSVKTGAPNACNDCHTDHSPSWAAEEIARRYPDSKHRGEHFAPIFANARNNEADAEALLKIAGHEGFPGIVRANALDLLRPLTNAAIAERLTELLDDTDPLVRAAAIPIQRGAQPIDRVQRLVPNLQDEVRSVRIAAAREVLNAPIARLPDAIAKSLDTANIEWRASLMAKADFPEAHMAIGGAALVLKKPQVAQQAFREAARLDPQLIDAWGMIVRISAAVDDRQAAREAVDEALSANPGNADLLLMREQLMTEN